ncbi:MAG: hypothetical protein ACM3TR_17385 [Caulobacteraceae bacterium]
MKKQRAAGWKCIIYLLMVAIFLTGCKPSGNTTSNTSGNGAESQKS